MAEFDREEDDDDDDDDDDEEREGGETELMLALCNVTVFVKIQLLSLKVLQYFKEKEEEEVGGISKSDTCNSSSRHTDLYVSLTLLLDEQVLKPTI